MASVAEIDKMIERLKEAKKVAKAKEKAKERKERTRRLIQIGAIVEKHTCKIENLDAWEKYILKYAGYIKKTQSNAVTTINTDLEMTDEPNPEVPD